VIHQRGVKEIFQNRNQSSREGNQRDILKTEAIFKRKYFSKRRKSKRLSQKEILLQEKIKEKGI
jgi:hypothetical protein